MKKIAITGNIGVGKSTVCQIFDWYSVPIFYSDDEAKNLYHLKEVRDQVIKLLGPESYLNQFDPNIKFISKVFSDKELTKQLTNIIRPFLDIEWNKFCELHKSKPYVLYESALIFEYNRESDFDKVILVTASLENKIRRIMSRNKMTKEQVMERINLQMSDDLKKPKSNFIIENNVLDSLLDVVFDIHCKLCEC